MKFPSWENSLPIDGKGLEESWELAAPNATLKRLHLNRLRPMISTQFPVDGGVDSLLNSGPLSHPRALRWPVDLLDRGICQGTIDDSVGNPNALQISERISIMRRRFRPGNGGCAVVGPKPWGQAVPSPSRLLRQNTAVSLNVLRKPAA